MTNTNTKRGKGRAWSTSVFMKQAMAVSGLFFVLFVLMHSYGNLKVLGGADAYNGYAHHLRTFGEPILPYEGLLWIMRVGLVVMALIHVISAFYLWHRAGAARGSRYEAKRDVATAYAARTMRVGGVLLLIFIVFHLLHFTTKSVRIGNAAAYSNAVYNVDGHEIPSAPWNMMVTSFANWWVVLIYLVAVFFLCLHISHGVWSALQSLGWIRKNTRKATEVISGLVGLLVFVMFAIAPVYILVCTYAAPNLVQPV